MEEGKICKDNQNKLEHMHETRTTPPLTEDAWQLNKGTSETAYISRRKWDCHSFSTTRE